MQTAIMAKKKCSVLHEEITELLKSHDISPERVAFVIMRAPYVPGEVEREKDTWCTFEEFARMQMLTHRFLVSVVGAGSEWWVDYHSCEDDYYSEWVFHECPVPPATHALVADVHDHNIDEIHHFS